jgi:hypothetical protein
MGILATSEETLGNFHIQKEYMDFQPTIIKFGSLLLQHFIAVREKKLSNDNFMHLLYLECKHNLALLDALRLNQTGEPIEDSGAGKTFLQVAGYLQTGVMEHILADCSRFTATLDVPYELYPPLDKDVNEEQHVVSDKKEAEQTNKKPQIDSIKHHLLNVYVKIVSLQSIATMDEAGESLRNIRYHVRLRNIKKLLLGITRALDCQLTLNMWQKLCRWVRRQL